MSLEIAIVRGDSELAEAAVARAEARLAEGTGLASVFLAGGATPRPVHRALAEQRGWPWWRTIVALGDERCVPPDHPDANYRSIRADLLDRVEPAAVLRPPGEAPSPKLGADGYAELLAGLPGGRASLVFLGMGADGHTASLFPGAPPTEDADVIWTPEPEGARHPRITVTDPFLERADEVVVLVSGAGKAARLAEVLGGGSGVPLARIIRRRAGRFTTVIADEAAAGALKDRHA